MVTCECAATHERRRIVLTGGPGAGKTALLELIRQSFCSHVKVLPEGSSVSARRAADGLAYWPGRIEEFWTSVGTTLAAELARYDAVIHLRAPALEHGYNHANPLRTQPSAAAADVDARILQAWQSHPRRFVVESFPDFLDKAARALDVLRGEMPDCCKLHVVPAIHGRQPTKVR